MKYRGSVGTNTVLSKMRGGSTTVFREWKFSSFCEEKKHNDMIYTTSNRLFTDRKQAIVFVRLFLLFFTNGIN
jgi:hypothetical protein